MRSSFEDYVDLWEKRLVDSVVLTEKEQEYIRFAYLIIKKDLLTVFVEQQKLESE